MARDQGATEAGATPEAPYDPAVAHAQMMRELRAIRKATSNVSSLVTLVVVLWIVAGVLWAFITYSA